MQAERCQARGAGDEAREDHAQRHTEQAPGRFDEAREHDRDEDRARGLDRGRRHERGACCDLPRIELGKPAHDPRASRSWSSVADGRFRPGGRVRPDRRSALARQRVRRGAGRGDCRIAVPGACGQQQQ